MNKAQDILRSAVPKLFPSTNAKPKSILKPKPKPAPLRLVPTLYSFTGSVTISQNNSAHPTPPITSPHVHFPSSSCLISTFDAHSPGSYDRAAISVSPNPLVLPERGDRVYDPVSGTFVASPVTSAGTGIAFVLSPAPTPKQGDKRKADSYVYRPPKDLGKALQTYPRSPYPTAPLSGRAPERERVDQPQRSSTVSGVVSRKPVASPLAQITFGPATSLSHAFWDAVSLSADQEHDVGNNSPVSMEVPNFAFATKDGALWSPGLVAVTGNNEPGRGGKADRLATVRSPAPYDPVAGFPSFSAVLCREGTGRYELVSYPKPAVTVQSPRAVQNRMDVPTLKA